MTVQPIHRDAAVYTRTPSKQEQITEALACIISGRACPAHLAPPTPAAARPTAVEQGIARILGAPSLQGA